MKLTLKEKFDFLWQDFVAYVEEGIKEGTYAKEVQDNFQELTVSDMKVFKNDGKDMPSFRPLDAPIEGKVLLTLRDVAILIDAGLEDFIEGNYMGFVGMLEKYTEELDSSVFNQVNASMSEMSGIHYMPFLSEKAKREFVDKADELKDFLPVSLLSSPYFFDFSANEVSWQDGAVSQGKAPTKAKIIQRVLESENERLRDISFLMLNKENLKSIGFDKYL